MPTSRYNELLLGVLTLLMGCSSVGTAADRAGMEVDVARQEIRFPCRFVNSTQLLEVFACHSSGPTHETVLEFDVTGPEIYSALEAIGCRNASYWDGTSPEDFLKTRGDRLLVLVRWRHLGKRHEHPAEGLLSEGGTSFPMPVRGFSFGARSQVKTVEGGLENEEGAGGEGAARVPAAVEFSLGAVMRYQPPNSLLVHPTSLKYLRPWMLSPVLDRSVVQGHRELVEEQVPATLIIRRVSSEVELLDEARSEAVDRGLLDSPALYDRLLPVAREIDGLKATYEKLLSSIRALLEESPPPNQKGANLEALAKRGSGLLRRGRWLCARIEERYLALYALEEIYKAAWIEKQAGIPAEKRARALLFARDGCRFEPLLAQKRVDLAALDLPEFSGLPAERKMRRKIFHQEIEMLELQRARRFALAERRDAKTSWNEVLSAPDDEDPAGVREYRATLFKEDLQWADIRIKKFSALLDIAQTEIVELGGLLDGTWEEKKADALRKRALGKRKLALTELEAKLLEIVEELRVSEDSTADRDPARRERARTRIIELRKKESEAEKAIEAARKASG